jgi:hypothetical protein
MPLRDFFNPPLSHRRYWDGFFSAWVCSIVRDLNLNRLSPRYRSEPWVHLGNREEGNVAAADQDMYEVRLCDDRHSSRPVAVVELVSPFNKNRPAHRRAFAVKCAAYIQQHVSVVLVDVVTERNENLHDELMRALGREGPVLWTDPPLLYACAYRTTKANETWRMDTWAEALTLGVALPTLPLWLASDLAVPLELAVSYEETCRVLRIG